MTSGDVKHKSLQYANNAYLLLLSRIATAVAMPLMVFFAVQVWDGVEELGIKQTQLTTSMTRMEGDINLINYRLNKLEP